MGLSPSCNLNRDLTGFRTLGDPPFREDAKNAAVQELRDAGLPRGCERITMREAEVYKADSQAAKLARMGCHLPSVSAKSETEWVYFYTVEAEAYGWTFKRAWYYWIAEATSESASIPLEEALRANIEYGRELRVDGFAGGRDSVERDVSLYHIDTSRALEALVRMLRNGRQVSGL